MANNTFQFCTHSKLLYEVDIQFMDLGIVENIGIWNWNLELEFGIGISWNFSNISIHSQDIVRNTLTSGLVAAISISGTQK